MSTKVPLLSTTNCPSFAIGADSACVPCSTRNMPANPIDIKVVCKLPLLSSKVPEVALSAPERINETLSLTVAPRASMVRVPATAGCEMLIV